MEAKRICPYCMGELESRVSVCPHCGAARPVPFKICFSS